MGINSEAKRQTLDEFIGPDNHSAMLLGTLRVVNTSHSLKNQAEQIVQGFKATVEKVIPDIPPDVPVEEMTSDQIQSLIDKANLNAFAENLLDEIDKS